MRSREFWNITALDKREFGNKPRYLASFGINPVAAWLWEALFLFYFGFSSGFPLCVSNYLQNLLMS